MAPLNHKKTDFKDNIHYQWMIVRTLPGQERQLQRLIQKHIRTSVENPDYIFYQKNILEVYNPVKSAVQSTADSAKVQSSLFAGHVFVLATHRALNQFLEWKYPQGRILYDRKIDPNAQAEVWTVPEKQMKFFREFNENYSDKVIVLERPYTDYAFNPKTNEPNATIKVLDGPLAGRIGYLTRFRGNRRLVFNIKNPYGRGDMAVAIPDIWNFHCVLLHNSKDDRSTLGTKKARAADLLLGILQGCGYGNRCIPMFHHIMDTLAHKPYLVNLCQVLYKEHLQLSQTLARLTTGEAALVLHLARYEQENPRYVRHTWRRLTLRPFLTPTAGITFANGKDYARLQHSAFTEYIFRQTFTEATYYAEEQKERNESVTYYAHVGIKPADNGSYCLFTNWDEFLGEYFNTGGKANKVLLESFRQYSPTLHSVLSHSQETVHPIHCMNIGSHSLNVMAISVTAANEEEAAQSPAMQALLSTCLQICREVSTTPHLAIWRRYLLGVWLHK